MPALRPATLCSIPRSARHPPGMDCHPCRCRQWWRRVRTAGPVDSVRFGSAAWRRVWYPVLHSPWRAALRRIPSMVNVVKCAVASNPKAAGPDKPDSRLSRGDRLRASTVLAAGAVFAEPLAAAAPEPTPPSAAMIQAARKEGTLAFYTAMELPLAEGLSKAFEAKYPGIKVRV